VPNAHVTSLPSHRRIVVQTSETGEEIPCDDQADDREVDHLLIILRREETVAAGMKEEARVFYPSFPR
jgi:hypothetical protein